MILLDTDHLSLLQICDTPATFTLQARLEVFTPNTEQLHRISGVREISRTLSEAAVRLPLLLPYTIRA
jgi:hypothetical protein